MSKLVLFRVDSGSKLGIGHVRRCITLANTLNVQGFECVFVCHDLPHNISDFIVSSGFKVFFISNDAKEFGWRCRESDKYFGLGDEVFSQADLMATSKIIDAIKPDIIVIDHYFLDKSWEEKFKHKGIAIVVIDDLANRSHNCDILVDQNYFGAKSQSRYKNLVPASCTTLLGPSYAIIENEYHELSKSYQPNILVNQVLIALGGSDPDNVTGKLIQFVLESQLAHLNYHVVLGPSNVFSDRIKKQTEHYQNVTIHQAPDSLLKLTSECDLVIGAGGSSTWERMALGIPSLIVGIAENQLEICQCLAKDGLIIYVGQSKSVTYSHFIDKLEDLVNSSSKRCYMITKTKQIVNGKGAQNVARQIEKHLNSNIK